MRKRLSASSLAALIAATSCLAMPAMAATATDNSAVAASADSSQLEEIKVTATKREEDPQKIPISLSVLSGADLEKTGSVNLWGEGANLLPDVYISKGLQLRGSTVQIRGVGSNGNNAGIEPSVGQYIDGVYIPQQGAIHQNLLDVEDIEVLRGPQGTLFGRNTPVGAININTREPQDQTEGMLRATAGNFNSVDASGYLGGEIASDVDGRVSAWATHHDGYEKNLWDGQNVNDDSQQGIRTRLKWHLSDNFTDNVIAYYSQINENCCSPELADPTAGAPLSPLTPGYLAAANAIGFPVTKFTTGDFTVDESVIGIIQAKLYGLSNQADYRFGNGHTLTSITAMNVYNEHDPQNGLSDGFPQPAYFAPQNNDDRTYSEELRISSPKGQTIDYVGGVYLYRQKLDYATNVGLTRYSNAATASGLLFPGQAADQYWYYFSQIADSEAIFAQATWNLATSLRAVGGVRETWGKKSADFSTTTDPNADSLWSLIYATTPLQHLTVTDSKATWLGALQYDISDHVMLYASASTGFKDGGISTTKQGGGIASPTNPYTFNPETSNDYEAGIKSTFYNRRLLVNLDVFRFLERDIQESFFSQPKGATVGQQILGNLGDIDVNGIEWDVAYKPIEQLTLTAGGLADKAKIENYAVGPCPPYSPFVPAGPVPGTCNYDGLRPPRSPSLSFVWSFEWTQPVTSFWSGYTRWNGSYSSSYNLDNTLDARTVQPSYSLFDARLGVTSSDTHWDLALWCKNLTNTVWYTANSATPGTSVVSSGGATSPPAGQTLYYGPPRTFGAEVSYRF